ncbi:hypothetical protein [Burkholderia pseudomallei]
MSSFSIGIGKKATIIFAETGSAEKRRFVLIGSLWRALAASPFAARHSLFVIRHSPPGAPCRAAHAKCTHALRARRNAIRHVAMRRKRRDAATASPRVSEVLRPLCPPHLPRMR